MRRSRSPGRARSTLSLVIGSVVVLSAFNSPSAASAAWSARLTATGSVSAGSLSIALGNALPSATFTNDSLSSTSSVTISNTTASTTAPAADLAVALSGDSSPLAIATNLVAWPVSNASECTDASTPGADAVIGNWANGVTLTFAAVSPGASQVVCLRSIVNARQDAASATGSQTFTTGLHARLAVHLFTADAFSTSAVGTAYIFPFSTLGNFWYNFRPVSDPNRCLDLTGGYTATPGAVLGTFPCHASLDPGFANQWFTLAPISGSLVGIRSAGTFNLYASASSTGAVTMQLRNASDPRQSWEPQLISPGVFQFVNDPTGLCLSGLVGASGPTTVRACDGSPGQAFTAVQLAVPPPTG